MVLGSIRNLTIIGEQSATGNQSSCIYLDLAEIGGCFRSRLLGKTASHTGSMSTCRQIILSVEANRVQASMRLITGMLVSSSVITQSTAMATESSQTAKGEPMSSICSSTCRSRSMERTFGRCSSHGAFRSRRKCGTDSAKSTSGTPWTCPTVAQIEP